MKPAFSRNTIPNAKSFLFIRPEGLGDIILTLPAIAYIRQQNPAARLAMAVRPIFAQFVSRLQIVQEVIPLDYPKRSTLSLNRMGPFLAQVARMRRRFDVAFDFRGDPRNAWIGAWAARTVVGPGAIGTNFLLSRRYVEKELLPMAERNLRIVSLEQTPEPRIEDYTWALRYRIDEEGRQRVPLLIDFNEKYVVIHPGASRPSNRWATDRWRDLIRRFLAAGEHVVITGAGSADSELVSAILREIEPGATVTNLVNRTSSSDLSAIVEKARLVISPDTGVAHIAFAHHVPSVTIFGSDSEIRWGHQTLINLVAFASIPCRPCMAYRCPRRDRPMECMELITVDQVWLRAITLMKDSSPARWPASKHFTI